jgi:metallo-beta-lactamase family protein
MKLSFYGAAQEVTGSKHLLTTTKGVKILLDCGLYQGRRKDAEKKNAHFGFNPSEIDCVILSHAHIDHSGLLPKLVKEGFTGPIYCTPATLDLSGIMLPDSAHIQESDIRYENKRREQEGKRLLEPLYDVEDAERALELMVPVPFYKDLIINDEVTLKFTENGHLLGSAAVNLSINDNGKIIRLCFTGDIGRQSHSMLKLPQAFPQADYIICESTYGDRLHEDEAYTLGEIVKIIKETCIDRKGKVIIPAFSIGRTQEIVYGLDYLQSQFELPNVPVYIDSPLSSKGTGIFRNHLELFNTEFQAFLQKDKSPFDFPNLHLIQSVEESKALNDNDKPCIIISASGMMEAGRIKHHVFNHIEDPNCSILMVGYCEPSTLGGRIAAGATEVKIFGVVKRVNAHVEYIRSFSGHGDYKEMIKFLDCQDKNQVKNIFLVHGDIDAQHAFSDRLREVGYQNIEIPALGSEIHLS